MLKCLHALSEKMAGKGDLESDDRAFCRNTCETFDNASESLVAGLRHWCAAVRQERGAEPWRTNSTIENIEERSADVVGFCKWMTSQVKGKARLAIAGFGKSDRIEEKKAPK